MADSGIEEAKRKYIGRPLLDVRSDVEASGGVVVVTCTDDKCFMRARRTKFVSGTRVFLVKTTTKRGGHETVSDVESVYVEK